jgi:hypothetical protein
MSKIISAVVVLAVIAHLIRPLGLPGLEKRADAWKLAVVAFGVIVLVAALRPQ